MHRLRSLLYVLAAVIFLVGLIAACGGQSPTPSVTPGPEGTEPTAQPAETEFVSPLPLPQSPLPTPTEPGPVEIVPSGQEPGSEPAPLTGEVPQDLLDAVFDDLVERIGVDREAITVEQTGAVVWRDGSLGCPQPGMMYTQALAPGYQIVLRVGEETYDYHASEGGYFVLCPEGMAEEPLPPGEGGLAPLASPPAQSVEEVPVPTSPTVPAPSSPLLQGLLAQAKEDLAKRLDIPTDQIDLVELSPVVWPDGGLGCPEPGVAYTQVQVEGLLIRLRAGKRVYEYHSGGGRPPFLCEKPSNSSDILPSPGLDDD